MCGNRLPKPAGMPSRGWGASPWAVETWMCTCDGVEHGVENRRDVAVISVPFKGVQLHVFMRIVLWWQEGAQQRRRVPTCPPAHGSPAIAVGARQSNAVVASDPAHHAAW